MTRSARLYVRGIGVRNRPTSLRDSSIRMETVRNESDVRLQEPGELFDNGRADGDIDCVADIEVDVFGIAT